ncbi:MAG: SRPBCC family protein [Acidobacteriota bacterium]
MASIRKEIFVQVPATAAWDAVRDVGAIHTRLAPGFVTDTTIEDGGAVRVVTFADGLVLRERIVALDDEARRLVWSVVDGPFEHHNASVQVMDDGLGCRVVWTADLLPDEQADTVAAIMESGLGLTKQTLEAAVEPAAAVADRPAGREQAVFCSAPDQPTLHHASLFVSDLEASTKFYTSGLGLTLRERFEDIVGQRADGEFQFGLASVFLEAGDGRYIELHPVGPGALSPPGFPLNHLALGVADLDSAYARAISAGGSTIDIPVPDQHWNGSPLNVVMSGERPEPMRMAFLLGPDGELIEMYQSGVSC